MKGFFIIAISIFLITFSACKNSDRDLDTGTDASKDFWVAANQFSNIIREVHKVAIVDSILNGVDTAFAIPPETCMDTMFRFPDAGPFPISLALVYTDTLVCDTARTRSGKIYADFSGRYTDFGTTIKINTENFEIDGVFFSGAITMTMQSKSADTIIYKISVTDGKIIDSKKIGNNVSLWDGDFTFYQYSGRSTVTAIDDNFKYFGSGTGMGQNGVIYSFTDQVAFDLQADCEYESEGQFTLVSTNRQNRVLKFGTGNCDNKMVVSIPPVNGDHEVSIR